MRCLTSTEARIDEAAHLLLDRRAAQAARRMPVAIDKLGARHLLMIVSVVLATLVEAA